MMYGDFSSSSLLPGPGNVISTASAFALFLRLESVEVSPASAIDEFDAASLCSIEAPTRYVGHAHATLQRHCAGIHSSYKKGR